MQYVCKTENGQYLAVIESDDGERLDAKVCDTKFAAMQLRERARNAGVAMFDHIDNPPPPKPMPAAKEAIGPFDHDGDGKPGGSLPRTPKPKAAPKPPPPVEAKPKRRRKPKAG